MIHDPYFERNFLTQRRVWMGPLAHYNSSYLEKRSRTWTYTTEFELDPPASRESDTYVLVLEGVKMGATIAVNGVALGNVTDQFLRFKFALDDNVLSRGIRPESSSALGRDLLSSSPVIHQLSITFDPSIATDGRFMACSGGWDWAPYSRAGDERGSGVWTFGIVKPIYVIKEHYVSIIHVVPKIYYLGPYARYVIDVPFNHYVCFRLTMCCYNTFLTQQTNVEWARGRLSCEH